MPLSRLEQLRSERGTTLVELMVALMAGMVILSALTMVMLTTMHGTARVAARVEATQRARLVMTQLMQELHSSCVSPEIAPVKEESEGNKLWFVHQTGSEVQPAPILSAVTYSNGTLKQSDYAVTGGTAPNWSFDKGKPSSTRTLLTKVSPISPSTSIFSYYRYSGGTLSTSPQATPLSKTESELTVQVQAALTAEPEKGTTVPSVGNSATVQNAASLRLTPPSFNEGSPSKPCA
jgi:type II secretory pathway component PulJ